MLTPSPQDLATTMREAIAGRTSEWIAGVCHRRSDISATILEPAPRAFTFYNDEDRWRFVAAHIAAALATPLPDVLDMSLAEAIRWHEQAQRLDGHQHEDPPISGATL